MSAGVAPFTFDDERSVLPMLANALAQRRASSPAGVAERWFVYWAAIPRCASAHGARGRY